MADSVARIVVQLLAGLAIGLVLGLVLGQVERAHRRRVQRKLLELDAQYRRAAAWRLDLARDRGPDAGQADRVRRLRATLDRIAETPGRRPPGERE